MLMNMHDGRINQSGITVFAQGKWGASNWAPGTNLRAVVVVFIESNLPAHGDGPIHWCSVHWLCVLVGGGKVLVQLLLCLCQYSILGLKRHAFALHN